MNIIRHIEFLDPNKHNKLINIIGVGAVGSHVATFIARLGFQHVMLWDFDKVGDHNIPNQSFRQQDIGKSKTSAVAEQMKEINPEINLMIGGKWEGQKLQGYVFVCPDDIKVRKDIYETMIYDNNIIAVFDTRIGLETAQLISANWSNDDEREMMIELSSFEKEEVEPENVSACGSKMTVLPTVLTVSNLAITNFINFLKTNKLKNMIQVNAFNI